MFHSCTSSHPVVNGAIGDHKRVHPDAGDLSLSPSEVIEYIRRPSVLSYLHATFLSYVHLSSSFTTQNSLHPPNPSDSLNLSSHFPHMPHPSTLASLPFHPFNPFSGSHSSSGAPLVTPSFHAPLHDFITSGTHDLQFVNTFADVAADELSESAYMVLGALADDRFEAAGTRHKVDVLRLVGLGDIFEGGGKRGGKDGASKTIVGVGADEKKKNRKIVVHKYVAEKCVLMLAYVAVRRGRNVAIYRRTISFMEEMEGELDEMRGREGDRHEESTEMTNTSALTTLRLLATKIRTHSNSTRYVD